MSEKKSKSKAQAPKTASPKAEPKQKKRVFNIFSLRVKFGFFTVVLIAFIMMAIGITLYIQQRRSLTREVLERGKTIAENAAASAKQPILDNDVLTLSVLAARSVQSGDAPLDERGYDFSNPQDWIVGMEEAFTGLQTEVPADLERELNNFLGLNLNLGFEENLPKARPRVQNEGVNECYVNDRNSVVVSYYSIHKSNTGIVQNPYVAPKAIQEANDETPFPLYEDEWFDSLKHRHVARLFDVSSVIAEKGPDGKDVLFGTVHIGLDEALIGRVVFQATMRLVDIAILTILFGFVFSYFVVTVMVAPVGRLRDGVLAIAGGDFNTRVKVASKDELGELTGAFNDMAKSLDENELLRGAFTRYVSDAALQQLLSDPSKTGLHSRRALATVYTSDVRGFTAMSESLEPEHVVQVINTYLSLQTEILTKHEGVVDKFIGDATVGVFGKEQERDDDAIRAVRSAVEVQKKIVELNKEREKKGEIAKLIGIGINTGIVVTGNMGSTKKMEYTTAGENVILADKLCAECPGGKVWISESTYEMVRDEVEVEEKEPLKLKGRSEPFPVFEVVGLK